MLTFDGRTMSIRAWSRETGVGESTIRARLRAGRPLHEALGMAMPDPELLTHRQVTKPLAEWAREVGIDQSTLRGRIRAGWPVGRALYQPTRGHSRA